jgi:hypothetical protein
VNKVLLGLRVGQNCIVGRSEMKNIKTVAEEEFQKLPLKEKQELVSVVQTWNKAFEYGFNYSKESSKKDKGIE